VGDCLAAVRPLTQASRSLHGPAVAGFEAAFAERIGVRYAYSFSSGRVGLYGILRALGIGEGDEVLLQAPTHIVVANAIRYVGARPVYVDCTLDTFEMQLDDAEAKIGPRTRALLLQHTFGIPGDLGRALEVCRRRGLALIEDCVHALGARYAGQPVGSFGSAAFFSTEETKTISTTMGGVAVTGDPEIATKLQSFQLACSWPPRGSWPATSRSWSSTTRSRSPTSITTRAGRMSQQEGRSRSPSRPRRKSSGGGDRQAMSGGWTPPRR